MRQFVIAFLLLILAHPLHATSIVPASLPELSRDARVIARGRVVRIDGRWTDGRRTIETLVTLEVESYLKGSFGETVQFRVPGGRLGRFRNLVIGAPRFDVGQRVIVFLGASGPVIPYVLGMHQGVYRVGLSGNGEWTVTPPETVGEAVIVRGGASRRPSPLADFERDVRALAGDVR